MAQPTNNPENELLHHHELREITELLIKHHGLTEGIFDLGIEFAFAIGPVRIGPEPQMPGGIFGIKKIGLVTADAGKPTSVDAAAVNPKKSSKKRTSTKTA